MPCSPESHPLDKARNIWYQQRPCSACPLAVARQHTHNRPNNRCCLELMKGKCREACLPQPANQLLPTSTDSNSTTVITTHLTLNIDMPLTLCKGFWNRMSPSQLLTRLWELDCGADLVVICGPGRETVLRSNGWRLPHTYAAHIEAQNTDFFLNSMAGTAWNILPLTTYCSSFFDKNLVRTIKI